MLKFIVAGQQVIPENTAAKVVKTVEKQAQKGAKKIVETLPQKQEYYTSPFAIIGNTVENTAPNIQRDGLNFFA